MRRKMGRPVTGRKRQLAVNVSAATRKVVAADAEREEVSISAWISEAIDDRLRARGLKDGR